MVKTTRQNTPVDRRELASVVAIQCWGLTVNFDGLSNSSLESDISLAKIREEEKSTLCPVSMSTNRIIRYLLS